MLINFRASRRRGEETLSVRSIEEWSEFRSRRFIVLEKILFGIFEINISSISEFLRVKVGQYVELGGTRTFWFFL